MDLQDQLKNLFPDHVPEENPSEAPKKPEFWLETGEGPNEPPVENETIRRHPSRGGYLEPG